MVVGAIFTYTIFATTNVMVLIAARVNPKVVQKRLGHADVSVTLNTYTHVLPQMDEEAAQKVDELLFKNA